MTTFTINSYTLVPYHPTGMDIDTGFNCFGLVRHARVHLFGKPELPRFDGMDVSDKNETTRNYLEVLSGYYECGFIESAIACAFVNTRMVHVGIVVYADGRMWVMETDTPHGFSLTERSQFEKKYTAVKYYDC